MVSNKQSGKVDQLTLANGGSEHPQSFSVTINWGAIRINEFQFLCEHGQFLLRQSHIAYSILHALLTAFKFDYLIKLLLKILNFTK